MVGAARRSTSTCPTRNGTRSGRTARRGPAVAAVDRDPSAIPPEAAARPDGRRPRRGRALALGRRPRRAGGAQPRHRQRHGAGPRSPRNGSALKPAERRLTGVRALELADPAEEAQAIALALREALEEPGRTAALVTPDRALARRVSAHLRRWGVEADDSAGRPLSQTPPGTLLLAAAAAAAERFAPVPLLALLKHPLVHGRAGAARLARRRAAARPRAARAAPAGRAGRHRRASGRRAAATPARSGGTAPAPPARAAGSGVRGGAGACRRCWRRCARRCRAWPATRPGRGRRAAPRRELLADARGGGGAGAGAGSRPATCRR